MRTGASTTRWPRSPGLSTSSTQPSTIVGSAIAGAIGAVTLSVLTLETAKPNARHASSIKGSVKARRAPSRRATSQIIDVNAAKSTKGQSGGSVFKAK
jgi:hypothetical protein